MQLILISRQKSHIPSTNRTNSSPEVVTQILILPLDNKSLTTNTPSGSLDSNTDRLISLYMERRSLVKIRDLAFAICLAESPILGNVNQ
mmetsp:Transcript_20289/g.26742  ORF Transcript_20289/g.26742 Transcript_20289/m.26742 type:complete len:89 (+) Transcript_20289:509-775(+)